VTDLGRAALNSTGLREHAHRYLDELRARTSYAIGLGVLEGTEVLYVDRLRSYRRGRGRVGPDLQAGSRVPAYCTAMGKLLLANLPEVQQLALLASMKLTKHAPKTLTSKRALRQQLEEIRVTGFAVSDQELAADVLAVAVPVRDRACEVVAAVNLVADTSVISL